MNSCRTRSPTVPTDVACGLATCRGGMGLVSSMRIGSFTVIVDSETEITHSVSNWSIVWIDIFFCTPQTLARKVVYGQPSPTTNDEFGKEFGIVLLQQTVL